MRAKFIYEKFSNESDPIHDMHIGGLYCIHNFKSMNKCFEWLYQIIPILVNVDNIMDIFNDKFNGHNGIIHTIMYAQINDYYFKYIRINNIRSENLISMDFKEYVENHKKINEKFSDESDPIYDMGIGSILVKIKKLYNKYFSKFGELDLKASDDLKIIYVFIPYKTRTEREEIKNMKSVTFGGIHADLAENILQPIGKDLWWQTVYKSRSFRNKIKFHNKNRGLINEIHICKLNTDPDAEW